MSDERRPTTQPPPNLPPEPEMGWSDVLGEATANPPQPKGNGEFIVEAVTGLTWTASSLEMRIKGQFELHLRKSAMLAVSEAESLGSPLVAQRAMEAYVTGRSAGHYNWPATISTAGSAVRAALGDAPGMIKLLHLLLLRNHPDVSEDRVALLYAREPRQCGHAVGWALGNDLARSVEGSRAEDAGTQATPQRADVSRAGGAPRKGRQRTTVPMDERTLDDGD